LGGLWAFECAWHSAETNLRCAGISGICMPNPSIAACIVSKISASIRTEGQADMARSTRLVILIKNIYTLWGRKRLLLLLSYESSIPFYSTSNGYKSTSPEIFQKLFIETKRNYNNKIQPQILL